MGLRKFFLVLLVGFCGMDPIRAAWEQPFDMLPESGVDITVALGFETFPRAGYVPCRVKIENSSPQPRTWSFTFSTPSGSYNQPDRAVLNRALSAKAGETAVYDLLIPIYPSSRTESSYQGPMVMISGPGVRRPMLSLPNSGRPGGRETPFLAMSPALAARSWSPLKTSFDGKRKDALVGSWINLELLGDDWRALAGVGVLFLSTGEYTSLPPGSRHALQNWVAQGGRLVLCGSDRVSDFGGGDGDRVLYNLGTVYWLTWDGASELDTSRIAQILDEAVPPLGDRLDGAAEHWKLAGTIGVSSRNTAFLATFITLFAVVIGPVNLFWFAGATRRHRLFWTTPLISIVASLFLGGVIFLQDGFGGHGARMTLHYLLPSTKEVLLMQEQASRAGLLLNRGFSSVDDIFLSPMKLPSAVQGWQGKRTVEQGDRTYGGDWFLSRASQAQFAEAVLPSREAVEIAAGQAPTAKSSIAVPLQDLYYIDADGACWHAENVRPGERVTLAPVKSMDRFTRAVEMAGPMLRPALHASASRRNYFYALAGSSSAIETLPSIRWKDDQSLYLGPVAALP